MRHRLPGSRRRLARLGGAFAAICALAAGAALIAGWRGASGRPAVIQTVTTGGTPQRNSIIVNGAAPGPVFDGVGAISGGGGNSRLLIDYPPRQRQQILDYLFKPRYGAALQILKVEIGGDANATDGAEPSYQHAPGQPPNCRAGYEFWLARQAQRLNPRIQVYALQWNAPHWAGGARQAAWTIADVRNVIGWLECARHDGITVSEVGGWNEHLPHGPTPAVLGWFVRLRQALDAHGFSRVKIIALDSFPHVHGPDVAKFLAGDAAFRHAVGILGYHDVCKHMALAHRCQVPAAALSSGKPIWVTEVGALTPPGGYAAMARSINNAYIEAGVTGTVEWPMLSSMPADLPAEDLGLIRASQPWSGSYQVGELTWVIAQTTEFTAAGWRYPRGGSGTLARGGSYVSYAAPGRRAWTVVAQTSDARAAQVVTVHVAGGLPATVVHVWSTDLRARGRRGWFVYRRTIRPYRGIFGYRLLPGYVYTFTTAPGPRRPGAQAGADAAALRGRPRRRGDAARAGADGRRLPVPGHVADRLRADGGGHAGLLAATRPGPAGPVPLRGARREHLARLHGVRAGQVHPAGTARRPDRQVRPPVVPVAGRPVQGLRVRGLHHRRLAAAAEPDQRRTGRARPGPLARAGREPLAHAVAVGAPRHADRPHRRAPGRAGAQRLLPPGHRGHPDRRLLPGPLPPAPGQPVARRGPAICAIAHR